MMLEYWVGATYFFNETAWFWLSLIGIAYFFKITFKVLDYYTGGKNEINNKKLDK